jgi:hypothetical protein
VLATLLAVLATLLAVLRVLLAVLRAVLAVLLAVLAFYATFSHGGSAMHGEACLLWHVARYASTSCTESAM